MDYGKILGRAWEITWRWKALWILGFLVSLGRGWGGNGNTSYITDSSDWGYEFAHRVPAEIWAILASIACVAILIGLALWVLSVIARGGLIAGVQQVEEEGATGFLEAWRVGRSRFWTLFGISILAGLPMLVLVLLGVAVLVLFITGTVGAFDVSEAAGVSGILASVLCGGTLCCGLVLVGIVLDQIRVYAERAAVLEGLGWIDAFKRGWEVLKNNLGPTLILWIIFLLIGLVFGVVIVGSLAAITIPLVGIFASVDAGPWMVAPICLGGLLGMIIFSLIGSVVETFTSATWTLAYRELAGLVAEPAAEVAAES
jgi:hypothetical protein